MFDTWRVLIGLNDYLIGYKSDNASLEGSLWPHFSLTPDFSFGVIKDIK